jgi:hypothetical protein
MIWMTRVSALISDEEPKGTVEVEVDEQDDQKRIDQSISQPNERIR